MLFKKTIIRMSEFGSKAKKSSKRIIESNLWFMERKVVLLMELLKTSI